MNTATVRTVHVVGEYFPTSTSPEERAKEVKLFKELFQQSNRKSGAETSFLKKRSRELGFNELYISGRMKHGDVVVHLDPCYSLSGHTARARYKNLMRKAAKAVGVGRTVFAIQNDELRMRLDDGQLHLWPIDCSPIFGWDNKRGVETSILPAPEDAMRIVTKILCGESPDLWT